MSVALIGFPTDVNSSFARGPAKAPPHIRRQMWSEAGNSYSETGIDLAGAGVVGDAGDVQLLEDDRDRLRIEAAIETQLSQDRTTLSLGGDHSITYPIVRVMLRRFPVLSIVHFDAHPDLYPSFNGNPFSHACPFARILEEADIALLQIGIRTMTDGPVYVSVDLDALDTISSIPGTVVGADVVELNPDRDIDGLTATVAAKLARELIARMHRDGQRGAPR